MQNKKYVLSLLFLGIILIFFGLSASIIERLGYEKLSHNFLEISASIEKGNIDLQYLNKLDKFNIGVNKKLTRELKNYLSAYINLTKNILNLENQINVNNLLNMNRLNESQENINIKKNELTNLNSDFADLKKKTEPKLSEEDLDIYKKLTSSITFDKYQEKIDQLNNIIDIYQELVSYLNSNNDYKIDNEIIFNKRISYDEFNNIVMKLNNYSHDTIKSRLDDLEAPIINAKDIVIYEGIEINIHNYINCVDYTDGEVECFIDGNYDNSTIGSYPIKISAVDKSGHSSFKTIQINVVEREKLRYYTEIIRNQNTVIVYELDDNKEYTKIAKVFPCSTGRNGRTPLGIYYSIKGGDWGPLMGGVWGQYYTVITGNILLHSVPYYTKSKDNLEWQEYNKLGSEASAGCVRLSVADAKWIYDNCPNLMKIKIYDGELPEGVVKPLALKIDESSPYRGWDPTDPDVLNPWHSNTESE